MSQKIQDPPKKPVNAFAYFVEFRSPQLKAEGIKPNEIFKVCGNEWKTLDDEKKEKFKSQFLSAMTKYAVDSSKWEEDNGVSLADYKKNLKASKGKTAASKNHTFVNIAVPTELSSCIQALVSTYLEQ